MTQKLEIDVTSTVMKEGVPLFETECTAIIDWDTDLGELDWEIRELRFEETIWKDGKPVGKKETTIGRGDVLFNVIRDGIDLKWLDEKAAEEANLLAFDEVKEWGVHP